MYQRTVIHMNATTSAIMEDLAIEFGVDSGLDSEPNVFNGYDFETREGWTVRFAQEDQQGGIEVYVLEPNGILRCQATFSALTPVVAIAAYAQAVMV